MKRQLINYETLLKIAKVIGHSRDPEEVALMTVESIKTALSAKGCSLFWSTAKRMNWNWSRPSGSVMSI